MAYRHLTLRPQVKGARLQYLQGCTLLDGYLFFNRGALTYIIEVRAKGRGEAITPCQRIAYTIHADMFGLFSERALYALPNDLGAVASVDHLQVYTGEQRRQLRRLLILLAMSVRAQLNAAKCSTCIHALTPNVAHPFHAIRNHYDSTGRARRDADLKAIRAHVNASKGITETHVINTSQK